MAATGSVDTGPDEPTRERAPDDRLSDIQGFDPATDRNCFSTIVGYSGFHGDPA